MRTQKYSDSQYIFSDGHLFYMYETADSTLIKI